MMRTQTETERDVKSVIRLYDIGREFSVPEATAYQDQVVEALLMAGYMPTRIRVTLDRLEQNGVIEYYENDTIKLVDDAEAETGTEDTTVDALQDGTENGD